MPMEISQIVRELKTLPETGTRVPGFRRKVLVDTDRLVALAEELGRAIPANIQEAHEILNQKDSIINQAYLEARRIKDMADQEASSVKTAAQQEHESRVDESEIVKTALSRADGVQDQAMVEAQDIVQDAQRRAHRILNEAEAAAIERRDGANRYAREMLFSMEEQLSGALGQIRRGIDALGLEAEAPQVETQVPA